MSTERTMDSFRDTLEAAGIDLGSLALASDGTVAATPVGSGEARGLPQMPVTTGTGELQLLEVIGEGGMGIVHEARQASLARRVAVKALRPDARGAKQIADFVREARVTGALEHPNVVPIHGLGVSEDGGPLLVMKRVVGRSWRELLHGDPPTELARHLDILTSVCHAVERAHSQGILHRDLKPENVMVGDFGEVLVVDWGLAVAFGDAPIADVPHTDSIAQIVGTPRYMAPEMAIGDGRAFGPATDVYLLGATLHEVLTGQTRHDGPTLMAMLYQSYASEPYAYGEGVPPELATIANVACHVDPKERYPSVAAFRAALLEYRAHAGSRRLTEEAERRLARDDDAELAACRFGFEQALAAWPDNERARTGLVATLTRAAERALERNALGEGEALLRDLEALDAERPGGDGDARDGDGATTAKERGVVERVALRARLESLRAELARRSAKLAELERSAHDRDLGMAAEKRRGYGIAFGILIGVYNVTLGVLARTGVFEADHLTYVVGAGAVATCVAGAAALRLRRIVPNQAARRLMWGLAVILAAQVPVFLVLGAWGVDVERALAVSLFQLAGSFLLKSVSIDPRMNWVAFGTAGLAALSLAFPALAYFAVGLAYGAFFVAGSLLSFEVDDEDVTRPEPE